ncbi:hypothetical protein DNK03_00575 [Brucella anthropi]|uniref:hypothetical protein n=1 Tax=Brucella anthropi TaxID=529 RepID=UPI000DECC814|nr:hypothetical protein [Brucella anthropi]RCI80122.1 hypothetical protein DNK03_00575 [Brucella anthropi]
MKIERFISLARSYGANIDLWPVEERGDALALLEISNTARAVLAEERLLDDALTGARKHQEISWGPLGERDAALQRLRTNVAARIAPAPSNPPGFRELFFAHVRELWPNLNWLSLSSSSGVAVAAGLIIGMNFPHLSTSGDLLSTLQVAAIPIFME